MRMTLPAGFTRAETFGSFVIASKGGYYVGFAAEGRTRAYAVLHSCRKACKLRQFVPKKKE